jgi:hypothetical protein
VLNDPLVANTSIPVLPGGKQNNSIPTAVLSPPEKSNTRDAPGLLEYKTKLVFDPPAPGASKTRLLAMPASEESILISSGKAPAAKQSKSPAASIAPGDSRQKTCSRMPRALTLDSYFSTFPFPLGDFI